MGSVSAAMLAVRDEGREFEVQLALGGFLAGHSGNTRLAYEQDLRTYMGWCQRQGVDLFEVRRGTFVITVPTSGELAARDQIEIKNMLETRAVITWVVGSSPKF